MLQTIEQSPRGAAATREQVVLSQLVSNCTKDLRLSGKSPFLVVHVLFEGADWTFLDELDSPSECNT
jgi:hypothetical protein